MNKGARNFKLLLEKLGFYEEFYGKTSHRYLVLGIDMRSTSLGGGGATGPILTFRAVFWHCKYWLIGNIWIISSIRASRFQCNGESESTSWSCHANAELRLLSQKEGGEPFCRSAYFENIHFSWRRNWKLMSYLIVNLMILPFHLSTLWPFSCRNSTLIL